jgi:aspartate--ammonia ligase
MAIKLVKDSFQKRLSEELNLRRVTAPLFVDPTSGLNDNLNGVERPVSPSISKTIRLSGARWSNPWPSGSVLPLGKYHFPVHEGLYTDMNAIRRDEELDNIHSLYVDQWDWEKVILFGDRQTAYLEETVRLIYKALKDTENDVKCEIP